MTNSASFFEQAQLDTISDEKLVILAQEGNREVQRFLLDKYKSLVRLKSQKYFIQGADSEDLYQEGMIGLYKAIRDYRNDREASFKVFAELCIKRQLLTAVKAASRQKHIPLNNSLSLSRPLDESDDESTTLMDIIEGKGQSPETICINNESYNYLKKHLSGVLSDFEKDVLKLFLLGKSYQSIAKRLNKQQKAVDNALQRIKKKMNKYLEDTK